MIYFDFLVRSKEKVTLPVCFSPQKRPFVTSMNGLKNEEIGFKGLFIIQFLGSIKNFVKLRQKGTTVGNTIEID